MFADRRGAHLMTAMLEAQTLFQPHPLVRQGDVQTLLSLVAARRHLDVTTGEQPLLLEAGVDHTGMDPDRTVRLLAYYTAQRSAGPRRGLVLALHGWEGSSHSNYNLAMGTALIHAGYDVVRLNLRDHGPTHHLNKGIFYSTLIEEAHTAAVQIAAWSAGLPFYIVGASLGGNFALRLALRWDLQAQPQLSRVIAINPVLNPHRTAERLDGNPLYLHYFRKHWLASLRRKQALFPDLYDFTELARIRRMRDMIEWQITRFGLFENAHHYFDQYSLVGDAFHNLQVPTTVITAGDDPIIAVQDFYELTPHPLLDVQIHPSGGHVGFTDIFPFRQTLPQLVIQQIAGPASTMATP